jgi:energy-coupling factor transport system permease protein
MSALHVARPGAGAAYCAALLAAALVYDHPLVLGALAVAVLGAGALARAGAPLRRALALGAIAALPIVAVNLLVDRNGLTVFWRLGELPPLGRVDLTVEALAYGGLLALRLLVVLAATAVFAAAVDVDGLLRSARRIGSRSALTAVLAVRLVPVLARDARRLEEARRCRADHGGDGPLARLAVLRAVCTGALDRATDVAATLEVRGYGVAGRPSRRRVPWSRQDLAFAASTAVLLCAAVGARAAGVAAFTATPELHAPVGPAEAALAGVLVVAALAPFAVRRGVR